MVITMSTPVKTSLKMFWTLWESSLSRLRPSQGTETLFTLCSTHQSLMCFLFVIKFKKKKFCRLLPVSLYIHQVFCFVVSLFPPHICLWMSLQYLHHMHNLHLHNVLRVPVVGLKKYHLFCGPVWDWTVGVFTHTWVITLHMSYHLRSYSHPPSLGPESSGPLQFAPKSC